MRSPSPPAQQRKARSSQRRVIFEYKGTPQPPSIQPSVAATFRWPFPILECGGSATAFAHSTKPTNRIYCIDRHPSPAPFAGEASAFLLNQPPQKQKRPPKRWPPPKISSTRNYLFDASSSLINASITGFKISCVTLCRTSGLIFATTRATSASISSGCASAAGAAW